MVLPAINGVIIALGVLAHQIQVNELLNVSLQREHRLLSLLHGLHLSFHLINLCQLLRYLFLPSSLKLLLLFNLDLATPPLGRHLHEVMRVALINTYCIALLENGQDIRI